MDDFICEYIEMISGQLRDIAEISEKDISSMQNEYFAQMAKIKRYLVGELTQTFSALSEKNIDENISFWNGEAGQEFKKALIPASNKINSILLEYSAIVASACIENFHKSRIGLKVSDYKPSKN